MKAKELREKTIEELRKLERELRKKIQELKMMKALKKLDKPHLLKFARKDLARVLTVINEKLRQK
ncbi:MAG: 50S ribosomal protein L29 [Candidatus Pacebacteria bacterium]|jgi:large subunit ribosomal protein L29|nr:50S ribosomal protein L29 [Candidatus Paceibacterota bacterium]